MSWLDITKKNCDIEQEKVENKKEEKEEKIYNPYNVLLFKNIEDEFEYKYLSKICNISFEFKEYIYNNFLPFMDKNINVEYTIYDFIYENSYEYKNVENFVNEYNNKLKEEYDIELKEIEEELLEEDNIE